MVCYNNAEAELLTGNRTKSFREQCNCLPTCTSIEYNVHIDHIKFDAMAVNRIRGFQSNNSEY